MYIKQNDSILQNVCTCITSHPIIHIVTTNRVDFYLFKHPIDIHVQLNKSIHNKVVINNNITLSNEVRYSI